MSSRILLIEDEPGVVLTLTDLLSGEGYDIESVHDGIRGLAKAINGRYDLILLDVMLPGKNGLEVCRELRERNVPSAILMLTARTQVPDRVAGLKLGADDYLTKPFDPAELLARIEALLRRMSKEEPAHVDSFEFGDVQVNFQRNEVLKAGKRIALTGKELQLLQYLVEKSGQVVSRDDLLQYVWEYLPSITSRTVDVHVAGLRQKLEENPQLPRHFHTVRGVGYRFAP